MDGTDISLEQGCCGAATCGPGFLQGVLVLIGSTSQHVFLGSAPCYGVASDYNKHFYCLRWQVMDQGDWRELWWMAEAYGPCGAGWARGDAALGQRVLWPLKQAEVLFGSPCSAPCPLHWLCHNIMYCYAVGLNQRGLRFLKLGHSYFSWFVGHALFWERYCTNTWK